MGQELDFLYRAVANHCWNDCVYSLIALAGKPGKSKISARVGFILRKKGAMNVQTNFCQRC